MDSEEYQRERGCTGKRRLSHFVADLEVRNIQKNINGISKGKKKKNLIKKINAYHCQFCGYWHIGKSKFIK